ncbi:hypothetical protein PIB30_068833 [Stylosanthes scabra]|uniref:Uncharacterized protein n=1 Tax=Stylosanthes scabra TaxID=79078 RepID=A0ABU6WPM6_9FABA|nr:hypothetical protein [Stylosanthes scabra]
MTGSLPEMDKRTRRYMHNRERTVVKPYPVTDIVGCGQQPTHELMTCTRKRHASFCLRIMIMGTRVIFYEEIAKDIVQTWDQFDTLFAERLRIRVHPTQLPFRVEPRSPPPAPVNTGVIGEPYDPLYDLAGFIDEYYRRPPEAVPAPMEADPLEDPMNTDDDEDGLADTDTGEDEDPEEVGQSEDSEDTHSDGHSVVSTDTCESRA